MDSIWAIYKATSKEHTNNICQYTSSIWLDIQAIYGLRCETIYTILLFFYLIHESTFNYLTIL
jgi:hypothetical protein